MSKQKDPLREAFEALAARAASSGPSCPHDDRIWSAARGELPAGEVRELLDHASGCPACLEAWRLAREVAAAAPRQESRRPTASSRAGWWTAAAAAVVAALALAAFLPRLNSPGSEPAMRAGETEAIRSTLAPDAIQPRDAVTLRWSAVHEGALYHVRVTSETLDPLFEVRDLSEPFVRVPPESLVPVRDGERLLWRVEAILPDGSMVASPTLAVVLAPPAGTVPE